MTDPAVTSTGAGVGLALSLPETEGLAARGGTGVPEGEAETDGSGVPDGEAETDPAGVPDAEAEADEAGVPDVEGAETVATGVAEAETVETGVPVAEGEATEADELAAVMDVGVGDGSGVGLAIACGTRVNMQRITVAATVYPAPDLRPAPVPETSTRPPSGPQIFLASNCLDQQPHSTDRSLHGLSYRQRTHDHRDRAITSAVHEDFSKW
jgi:hypothetical protein